MNMPLPERLHSFATEAVDRIDGTGWFWALAQTLDKAATALKETMRMTCLDEILHERQKQAAKGFDAKHDDEHDDGALAIAAGCLAIETATGSMPKHMFPWDDQYAVALTDQPARRRLVIAAALIVAEIERLERKTQFTGP